MTKEEYLAECNTIISNHKPKHLIWQYYLDKKRHRKGVVVAFNDNGTAKVGWSMCKTKLEPFNRSIGLRKAIDRAYLAAICTPHSMLQLHHKVSERAAVYFKGKK
ncbi:MAG: hypothetical protein H7831_06715 [Magnetococcus sp. WYHC-3]